MATRNSPARELAQSLALCPVNISRIFRAHVMPRQEGKPERTAFVEANSEAEAHERIVAAVAAMEWQSVESVRRRVCGVASARQCVAEGISELPEHRLFETAWAGVRVTDWVREPLFLVDAPAVLVRVWFELPQSDID